MLKPLSNRIVVKPHYHREETKSGLYLPAATTTFQRRNVHNNKQTMVGQVVSIGDGKFNKKGHRRKPDVPVGTYVVFSDSCGQKVEHENEAFFIIREDDIIGFLEQPVNVEMIYPH